MIIPPIGEVVAGDECCCCECDCCCLAKSVRDETMGDMAVSEMAREDSGAACMPTGDGS